MLHEQDVDYEDSDDCYPSQLRPYWNRRLQSFDRRHAHEIDILLAGIAGAVLTALIIFGFIHR